MTNVDGEVSFRVPMAVRLVVVGLLFGAVSWMAESPRSVNHRPLNPKADECASRWPISQGRLDEATTILAELEAENEDDKVIPTLSQSVQNSVIIVPEEHTTLNRHLYRPRQEQHEPPPPPRSAP